MRTLPFVLLAAAVLAGAVHYALGALAPVLAVLHAAGV